MSAKSMDNPSSTYEIEESVCLEKVEEDTRELSSSSSSNTSNEEDKRMPKVSRRSMIIVSLEVLQLGRQQRGRGAPPLDTGAAGGSLRV